MSAYKVVRDSAGRCRGCGPNDSNYDPAVPAGGFIELSDDFVPIDLSPGEQAEATRKTVDENERRDCAIDVQVLPLVNQSKAEWITWAGANFPSLTAAEKTRLGILFWVVSVGVRRSIRNGGG